MLLHDLVVGHAGDVVAHYGWEEISLRFVLIIMRQGGRVVHPEAEESADD